MEKLNVGDKVKVMDEGLLMLMQIVPNAKPNNIGVVSEIFDDGKLVMVAFPIGNDDEEEHSQIAPYPIGKVVLLES